MKYKIGILTQPLKYNYGGILQAYALQKVLLNQGHEVIIIDRHHDKIPTWRITASHCKTMLLKLFSNKRRKFIFTIKDKEDNIIGENINNFINKNINKSRRIFTDNELEEFVKEESFDAFIVGSDQVWRPKYSPNIMTYFLDFAKEMDVKRIGYAISFGVSEWEFSKHDTINARKLAEMFDSISVREDSGIDLCSKYLNIKANHVLDPTMLLSKGDYLKLIGENSNTIIEKGLFTYILDKNNYKTSFINQYCRSLNIESFSVQPEIMQLGRQTIKQNIDKCVYPPVENWLRAFLSAEFVITDSFHGCVFSIIFNKPFVAIGNNDRGLARFESLLRLFGLEDRLVISNTPITSNINDIDWNRINRIMEELKSQSFNFLNSVNYE